jgi:hypothetical protein
MDRPKLCDILGLAPGGALTILRWEALDWGRELVFVGQHRHEDSITPFELRFTGCREIQWRVYVHDSTAGAVSLDGLTFGRSDHRSPAKLLTDAFGLTLWYGEMTARRLDSATNPSQNTS